jgi:predicted N-formylglutamate amidohydrolase
VSVASLPPLLQADEPPPFSVIVGHDSSPYLITCDHAGRDLPRALGTLGLSAAELDTHIACDIGAAAVARRLGAELGAFVILQPYSRLVIDCNRPLEAPSSIVRQSEHTAIPGNQHVSERDAERRAVAIFHPYHDRIRRELERREARGLPTILVAVHSFTPVFMGSSRPWHIGVLYQRDPRLGRVLLGLLTTRLRAGGGRQRAVCGQRRDGLRHRGIRRAARISARGAGDPPGSHRRRCRADGRGRRVSAAYCARQLPELRRICPESFTTETRTEEISPQVSAPPW